MAITQLLSAYDNVLEPGGTYYLKQVNLANQNIKDVTAVYAMDQASLGVIIEYTKCENIEAQLKTMVDDAVTDQAYYEYKNEILHLSSKTTYTPDDYGFYFVATKLATPIETLDDPIDIPNSLVPLFVQKVLSNVYQLQGKETPLPIKRRIKELE